LPKEGYQQHDIDKLFMLIVLPKIAYCLPIYATLPPELTTIQNFLQRCFKCKYISFPIQISDLVEKADSAIFEQVSNQPSRPLFICYPKLNLPLAASETLEASC